jgi:hypothetical protein
MCANVRGMLPALADFRNPNSLASRMRARRNQWFRSRLENLPRPLTILDVGGTPSVWEAINFADQPDIQITLLNVYISPDFKTTHTNITNVLGDARDMHQYADKQFDVVYLNSCIEHVGGIEDMRRMANEMRRVGKHYFLQTPNRNFPVEPHFVFPMFQFLPLPVQVFLVQHFSLGWFGKIPDREKAEREVRAIQLISKKDVQMLFPDANLKEEKFAGLTKSLLAYTV